ncbi:MAG: PAS domain S-box protein [Pseudomonadota bacterium]
MSFICVFLFVVICLLLAMLRRQARAHTRELQAEIRERQRTEEILSRRREFLFILLETLPLPLYYKDIHGKYIGCNPAFEAFIGFNREEIIGKTVFDLVPKEVADHHDQRDGELLERPGRQRYEYPSEDKDGQPRRLIFYKATLINIQGQITGTIGVISDITEGEKA